MMLSYMTPLHEEQIPTAVLILTGVVGHVLFKHFEPRSVLGILSLLLGPPTAVAMILHQFYSTTFLTLSASYTLYFGTLMMSVVAYRLSPFHPLAHFPGPTICKVSRLWAVYIVYVGDQHLYYKSLHAQYGTHIRTGPNHLHICDAEAIPTILGPKGFPRSGRYDVTKPPGSAGSLLSLMDVHEHARRRRIWDRSLNTSAIQGYQGMLARRVDQLVEAIEKQSGELDLSLWLSCFSFDFMGDLAFGGSFKLMEQGGDSDNYMYMARVAVKYQEMLGDIPWIRRFQVIFSGASNLRRFLEFARDSVLARKAQGSAQKDIFYYLLDEEGLSVSPLSVPTLISESGLVIGAGSETVGTALSNILFNLIARPDILGTLKSELDDAFPRASDELDPIVLASLEYLNAVINETLRLWPAVPSGVQRIIPHSTSGAMIAGRWVTKSTTVQVPTFSVHRDPRYFSPDPDSFRPERWFAAGFIHNQAAYFPFSYGPMNCVGKTLAIQELRMVTSALVRKFDFQFAPGWDHREWERNLHDAFVFIKGNMPVVAEARDFRA